jgi:inosose dehydratase
MENRTSRRGFLKGLGAAAASLGAAGGAIAAPARRRLGEPPVSGLRLGLASYSFRAFKPEQALDMTQKLGLTRLSVKDMHLPLDESLGGIRSFISKARARGIEPYAAGVVYMKTAEDVARAFKFAKTANLEMIVGVPDYDLLPKVEEWVTSTNVKLAIHNHGPEDKLYPSPESIYARIQTRDMRIGVCMDIGHTMRCGIDPAVSAEHCFDRLLDIHSKDVTEASVQGATLEAGRGVIDIPNFFRTLMRLGYAGTVSLEYEKDEKDPLPGAAESNGYFRGVLTAMGARIL